MGVPLSLLHLFREARDACFHRIEDQQILSISSGRRAAGRAARADGAGVLAMTIWPTTGTCWTPCSTSPTSRASSPRARRWRRYSCPTRWARAGRSRGRAAGGGGRPAADWRPEKPSLTHGRRREEREAKRTRPPIAAGGPSAIDVLAEGTQRRAAANSAGNRRRGARRLRGARGRHMNDISGQVAIVGGSTSPTRSAWCRASRRCSSTRRRRATRSRTPGWRAGRGRPVHRRRRDDPRSPSTWASSRLHRRHERRRVVLRHPRRPRRGGDRPRALPGGPHHPRPERPLADRHAPAGGPRHRHGQPVRGAVRACRGRRLCAGLHPPHGADTARRPSSSPEVAVATRTWATLNPKAMFRDPITVADVLYLALDRLSLPPARLLPGDRRGRRGRAHQPRARPRLPDDADPRPRLGEAHDHAMICQMPT